ncbi:MAG: hypothetical protein R6X20_04805 [Phycisphaerae bacterium]
MSTIRIPVDVHVAGALTAQEMNIPDGTVDDDDVEAGAGLSASKLEHQHALTYKQDDGSDVVAAVAPLWTCRGTTATVVAVEAVCIDAPSGGGTEQISVDLKKCNQASPSPASILTGTIDIDDSIADCEVVAGSINTASLADGDTLVADVSVSGTGGTQEQGLVVTVTVREDAEP